jgi:RimJ/RimL family protein N-acetyltransferase
MAGAGVAAATRLHAVKVRRAIRDDAEAFAAVVADVAAEDRWIGTEPPVDVSAFAERVRRMLAGGDVLWVLEDEEGRVVGTLGLHATRAAGVMSVGMCIVEPFRGRGGGRAFIEAALAHARQSPLHKLELEAWPDNERAIALYRSAGFEVEGERRSHYRRRDGSLRSSVLMGLLLEPQSRPPGGT